MAQKSPSGADRESRLSAVLASLGEDTDQTVQPGRYEAHGGYVYVVNADGSILIEDGPTGKGKTLTSGKAYDAIKAQLAAGDLPSPKPKRSMDQMFDDATSKAEADPPSDDAAADAVPEPEEEPARDDTKAARESGVFDEHVDRALVKALAKKSGTGELDPGEDDPPRASAGRR